MPLSATSKRMKRGICVGGRGDAHAADVGELDGVAGEVEQNLAHAAFVGEHLAGEARVRVGRDVDAFFEAAVAQEFGHAFDQRARRERGFFHRHGAGFDLREIEDVVDDVEQRLARLAHGVRVGALFGRHLRVEQETRHADDAVHGRADFVAHGGQEHRLRAVGVFGFVAGFAQRGFEFFLFGDVAGDALDFGHVADIVADGVVFPGEPAPALVRLQALIVAHAAGRLSGQRRRMVDLFVRDEVRA